MCDPCERLALHLSRFERRVVVSRKAEHLLLLVGGTSLRLDVEHGTVLAGPVMLEPLFALNNLDDQIVAIRTLDALLREVPPPRERDPRLPRLLLALRVLDGRTEGASLRELAVGIFGAHDWPGDGENVKSRVRRLVSLSETLWRAGPAGVLASRI